MAEDDCGATFELAQGDEGEIISVTIEVTDSAMSAMEGAMSSSDGDDVLVVSVLGGGCSGFSYVLDLTEQSNETDETFEQHGIKVACDPKSYLYLNGTTIDFKDEVMGRGFVFNNPNATSSCGCGSSFSA